VTFAITQQPPRLYDTILVGVDEGAQSVDALLLAKMLAEPSRARLIVTHVSPPSRWVREDMREELTSAIAQRAREILAPAARAVAEYQEVEFRTLIDECVPRALSNLAEAEKAQLIVVGSTSRAGLDRVTPGSTGSQLLNGVACQVAVAPRGFRLAVFPPRWNAIGVAYDGSADSREALELGTQLARQLNAQLRVIRVIDPAEVITPLAYAYGIPPSEGHMLEIRESVYAEIDEVVSSSPIPIKSVLLDGPAAKQLIDCSHEVSLLILGSRGFGPTNQVLTGATSSQVLRRAHAPLILVPRGDPSATEPSEDQAELSAMCS